MIDVVIQSPLFIIFWPFILVLINCEKIFKLQRRIKELERKDAVRVFGGKSSSELWAEINAIDNSSSGDDVHNVLYSLVCKLQEHEASSPIMPPKEEDNDE